MNKSANPSLSGSEWTLLLQWIDQAMLDGVGVHPMPATISQMFEAWGISLSEDPVVAFHEVLALTMPLYHTQPARTLQVNQYRENRPLPSRTWTAEQEDTISRILRVPGIPGATEAVWLIQRNGWSWPESAVPTLLAHLQANPRDWPTLGRHLPPLATWLARQVASHHAAFPQGPPDLRQLGFNPLLTYIFRWTQLAPERALPWLEDHHTQLDTGFWESFLDLFGDLLTAESLDLLRLRTDLAPPDKRIPWLRVRARLGDRRLLDEVVDRMDGKWRMEADSPALILPEAGPAWQWSGSTGQPGAFNRSTALYDLASCLPANYWTSMTGMGPSAFIAAVFRSDQQRLWVNLIYHQLRHIPDPEWCLAFLDHHLEQPEVPLDGPAHPLTRHIPSTQLAPLLESKIHHSRFQLWLDRPEGQLLTNPGLFWTESLLEAIFHAVHMRPALAVEASVSESFITALAWRSHLGGMLRRSAGNGLKQALPGPLSRLTGHILDIIHLRRDLHQAFDTKASSHV